ncbi:hypothetical protein D3C83_190820 [compost metagenome]
MQAQNDQRRNDPEREAERDRNEPLPADFPPDQEIQEDDEHARSQCGRIRRARREHEARRGAEHETPEPA